MENLRRAVQPNKVRMLIGVMSLCEVISANCLTYKSSQFQTPPCNADRNTELYIVLTLFHKKLQQTFSFLHPTPSSCTEHLRTRKTVGMEGSNTKTPMGFCSFVLGHHLDSLSTQPWHSGRHVEPKDRKTGIVIQVNEISQIFETKEKSWLSFLTLC